MGGRLGGIARNAEDYLPTAGCRSVYVDCAHLTISCAHITGLMPKLPSVNRFEAQTSFLAHLLPATSHATRNHTRNDAKTVGQ